MKKYLFAFVLLIGALVIIWIVQKSMRSLCGNTRIIDVASPNGRLVATLLKRNCGATTEYSTQLVITSSSSQSTTITGVPDAALVLSGSYEPKLIWEDNEHLIVILPSVQILQPTDVITMATKWHGLNIIYHRKP